MSLYGQPGACYIDLPADLISQHSDSNEILYVTVLCICAVTAVVCVIGIAIRKASTHLCILTVVDDYCCR